MSQTCKGSSSQFVAVGVTTLSANKTGHQRRLVVERGWTVDLETPDIRAARRLPQVLTLQIYRSFCSAEGLKNT